MDYSKTDERWEGQPAASSPLVVIIVVLCVVVLARVDTWLHGELLHFREAEREISQHSAGKDEKKKSSSSIQGEYTAEWLQSLWIKKSRSVSTSGLRRDGLSSCCCCQRLVQKKDKVMEGRNGQERHKHKEEFTLYISDLKPEKAGVS